MLIKMFEEQVHKNPDKIAVQLNDDQITYAQLNNSANQIAYTILKESDNLRGSDCSKSVALLFEHSIDMIEGMMGALKAGLVYVPLDPSYPEKRLLYMVEHSTASLIVTNQKNYNLAQKIALNNSKPIYVLNIDLIEETILLKNIGKEISDEQMAYILYTSGSTGNPKGVKQTHKNIWHFIKNYTSNLAITSNDRMTLVSSFSHDAAVMDIYGGLLNGATLYPIDIKRQVNIEDIAEWIIKERITIFHSVPTVYRYFIKTLTGKEKFPDLRFIVLGGESVIKHDVVKFKELFQNTTLVNLYGQSESSYNSSQFIGVDTPFRKVTLGEGVEDTNLIVITDEGEGALPLEEGEIIIDSEYVALGYWNDEEKTKEVFINHPTLGKLYKTGDIGQLLVNGEIKYLGRKDFQVKIRGYRIELGDIETQLLSHPKVKEGIVIAKEDLEGNKYLVAFMVMNGEVSERELIDYFMDRLPDYMIPTYFKKLDQLPLTPNNKVDRKALIQLDLTGNSEIEYVPPTNETEEVLVKIWAEILGEQQIGIKDNFFQNGGNSLLATQMLSKIFKEFKVQIPLREIFTTPTIAELSTYIRKTNKTVYSSIPVLEKKEYYPVSSAQKRLFILNQFEKDSIFYNMPKVMYIDGKLNQDSLKKAFNDLIDRHESLRTSFHTINGEIVQKIHEKVDFQIVFKEAKEEEIDELVADFIRTFDLGIAPLLRVEFVKVSNGYILMYDMHHIISDGFSMGLLINDFVSLYYGIKLTELKIQYKDFATWQNNYFKSTLIKKQEEYWLKTFSGEISILNMPTDHPRPAIMNFEGDKYEVIVGIELTEKLNRFATDTNTTLFMVILAAYNILLLKYTRQEDIIVGSPIAGRSHSDVENIIGIFINMLAFRNNPTGEKTTTEFLNEVKENAIRAYENQDYQFEMLVEKLKLKRSLNRNPLFDTMFVLQNLKSKEVMSPSLKIEPYEFNNKVAKFDLSLYGFETDMGIKLNFEYSTSLFKKSTIERLAEHFLNIINEMVENPDTQISNIRAISAKEKNELLYEFNNTKVDYPKNEMIHLLFEKQVEKTPDQVALIYEKDHEIKSMTYKELNQKSNRLAHALRKKNIQPNDIVGLMVSRSLEIMVGIFGILKAGGAYVPIDPDYPNARIEYMLNDSNAKLLLTESHLVGKIDFQDDIIELDDESLYTGDDSNLNNITSSENLAYIIYTSGSMGKPKGVMLKHCSVSNFIHSILDRIEFTQNQTILSLTTISFDIFVLETILPLSVGLKVVIGNEKQQYMQQEFNKVLQKYQVDILQATPSRMKLMLSSSDHLEGLQNLKSILIGGETFPSKLFEQLRNVTQAKIFNMYGPTETTVWSTMKEVLDNNELTIGKPIANTQIYILNQHLKPVPINVPGEVYISGDGLASGYLNRPELTNERFVQNPFIKGEKMYRTGDLAKWQDNGEICFLGRIDHQVKIRGFRIEMEEIESQLFIIKGIEEVVVVDREEVNGDKYLVAYIVSVEELSVEVLRRELAKELPDYMIPSHFIFIDQMPLTPNGKIDRKALPAPDKNVNIAREYIAPTNEIEEMLVKIWSQMLVVNKIGVTDNFFELGGHSFKVISLISQVFENFGIQLSMKEFFIDPTIRGIANYIIANRKEKLTFKALEEPYILFNHGQKKKLFCFPPGRGFGLAYANLANCLNSYSIYGFNYIEDPDRVKKYVKMIEDAQVDGSLVLIGHSAGGKLAFEVAKELINQGRIVSDLILLDVHKVYNFYPTPKEKRNAALKVINFLDENEEYKSFVKLDEVRERIIKKIVSYMEFTDVDNSGMIDANIHLILAKETPGYEGQLRYLWSTSTTKKFITYKGFGYHGEMLDQGYVNKNGIIIEDILRSSKK